MSYVALVVVDCICVNIALIVSWSYYLLGFYVSEGILFIVCAIYFFVEEDN